MSLKGKVRLRILRDNPEPPRPDGSACVLGLQDKDEQLYPGIPRGDGFLSFDFELAVSEGPDPERPVFSGAFASGSPAERFVYLSWARVKEPGYVNRIKVRLADIDWAMVRDAQLKAVPLEMDASGRQPGGGNVPVAWRVGQE